MLDSGPASNPAYPIGYWSCLATGVVLGDLPQPFYGFHYTRLSTGFTFIVPMWFVLVINIGIASVAWLPIRFSLRALLIATTLVAVGLGLIVWLR